VFDHISKYQEEKRVENTTRSGVFLTDFEVFGNVVKHCLDGLNIFSVKTKITEKMEKRIIKSYGD